MKWQRWHPLFALTLLLPACLHAQNTTPPPPSSQTPQPTAPQAQPVQTPPVQSPSPAALKQPKDWMEALLGPDAAQIKAAAEKGDPLAQYHLGSAYRAHNDHATALLWFKRSAYQGNASSQVSAAEYLIGQQRTPLKTAHDGLRWLLLAANQNHSGAQLFAGRVFETGQAGPVDKAEAFKWFSLAANQNASWRHYVDKLMLKMNDKELAEGQKRLAEFRPTKPGPVEPELKLQGISGVGAKRLALIGGHSFAAGETAKLKVEEIPLTVKCVEIKDSAAVVEVNGHPSTTLEMK